MKKISQLFLGLAIGITIITYLNIAYSAPTPPATKFKWNIVTENTDGSSANVTGYKIYCGATSGSYTIESNVIGGTTDEFLIKDVVLDGKFYCAMTAYTPTVEGGYSNEIFLDVTGGVVVPIVPKAPTFWVE